MKKDITTLMMKLRALQRIRIRIQIRMSLHGSRVPTKVKGRRRSRCSRCDIRAGHDMRIHGGYTLGFVMLTVMWMECERGMRRVCWKGFFLRGWFWHAKLPAGDEPAGPVVSCCGFFSGGFEKYLSISPYGSTSF